MNAIYMTYTGRKSARKRSHRKRMRKSRRPRRLNGGCNCSNSNPDIIIKGGSNQLGPSPGLDQLPIRSYYDLNTHENDANSPNLVMNARTEPNMVGGGKSRRRRRRSYKRNGRMKGGGFLDGYSMIGSDSISNFGTSPGAFNSNDLLRGNFAQNPNPSVQPITQMFNSNNPQLV